MTIMTKEFFLKELDKYSENPDTPELDKYLKEDLINMLRLNSRPSLGLFYDCSTEELDSYKKLLKEAIEKEKEKGRITLIELHNGHYPLAYFKKGNPELIKAYSEQVLNQTIEEGEYSSSFSLKVSDYTLYEKNMEYLEADLITSIEDIKEEFGLE